MTKENRTAAIREAASKAGGVIALAKAMGVTHQAVYYWLQKGFVPPARAVVMEALYGVDRWRTMDPALVDALNTNVADYL